MGEGTPGDSHQVKEDSLGGFHQVKVNTPADFRQVRGDSPEAFHQAKEGTLGDSHRVGGNTPEDFHQVKENTLEDTRQAKENIQQDIRTHTLKATHTRGDICVRCIRTRGEGYLRRRCKSLWGAEEERLQNTDVNLPLMVPPAILSPATTHRPTVANPPMAIPALPPIPSLTPPAVAATRPPPQVTILVSAIPPIATARFQKKAYSVHYTHMATQPAAGTYSAAAGDHGTKGVIAQGLRGGNSTIITIRELEVGRVTIARVIAAALRAVAVAVAAVVVALARSRSRDRVGGVFGSLLVYFLVFGRASGVRFTYTGLD